MKNRRKNYTLTEILVVIIILAVVMAIALPGFNNLVNGNKTMRAAKQLATAFQQARAEAIVSGCNVVLLLPCQRRDTSATVNTNIRLNYSNSSYGMLVCKKDRQTYDLNSAKNSNFKWQRLPSGVIISLATTGTFTVGSSTYFDDDASMPFGSGSNLFNLTTVANRNNHPAFIRAGMSNNGNFGDVPCVIFYPDGTANTDLKVFLVEGYVNGSGRLAATSVNSAAAGRPFNAVGFEFNRFTGRIRYYETL